MKEFNLNFSAFSVCWLRAYDFGLGTKVLGKAIAALTDCPLVQSVAYMSNPGDIDDIDARMFDVRYQERSNLVRIRLQAFDLVCQDLGQGRCLSTPIAVNLLLDLGSGFGVLNLCLARTDAHKADAYSVDEIGFLTRQWLLTESENGDAQRLKIRLPLSDQIVPLFVREAMNYYFLQLHKVLWTAAFPQRHSPLAALDDFQAWVNASREIDPLGCIFLRELYQQELTRSLFPTSFGPVLDVWGMEEVEPEQFSADIFGERYAREIAWLFTDGQRTNLGESLRNERQTESLALFIWPNHALYVNQNPKSLVEERVIERVVKYGCLDVEVVRIFEILNLQSALLRAFDRQLDEQLETIASLGAQDLPTFIKIAGERRSIVHSMRSFDFFNLFHTAYWESVYARLLTSPHLRLKEATDLVEMKSERLEEEIQQAVIIQDRMRQQQEREQELDVLRGLHSLSLANDIQNDALLIINFVVSATASFGLTEVLSPWLTLLSGADSSFADAFPLEWIGLNVGIFTAVALLLNLVSKSLIRSKSKIIEMEGRINLPCDGTCLRAFQSQGRDLEYFHLDVDGQLGYLRIRRPYGVLFLEFDRKQYYRYVLFVRNKKWSSPKDLNVFVAEEVKTLREGQTIP
ncbi:MAG: hypothetical protein M1282_03000 [Chloroflexi bacterium]|nr:hypothetical protein [Chloroflexota bacterium]